ncbi:unnamed protein product [Acanthoscelides obtectus]|uniref:Uncharacterized protein n=1 Tax=Acanthoscelides obtectus TaxID=200917 RepID=A0A9P0K774_ACAOB|nr:unnamed protein product [Acanthoscelides obtectus]CAH1977751.1 unnamed protein product [Acanthoscelides obtectus]CAK1651887.1 hypothetical protein AOBTE_LOCUS17522 [Acanthoscelides obtectus]CAK1685040.1 hypothetical protein AOBTE_LOCUS35205 [Acanthoscelides obtectus]
MDSKNLAKIILLEDEEEDEEVILWWSSQREDFDRLYQSRKEEGYFKILMKNHLDTNEQKFREFFRLNKEQFQFVLNIVSTDLKKKSTNTVHDPISPEEKLALALR